MPVLNPKALVLDRVEAVRNAHTSTGIQKAEVDLSGGIDSAVILGIVAKAIGPDNVIAVHSQINSNPDALERAQLVADTYGVKLCVIDLTEVYSNLVTEILTSMAIAGYDTTEAHKRIQADKTILGSIRSTLRAPVGRGYNRIFGGGLRHGTGNECEDRWLRFYQKGGDGEVDSNPIAMLTKGEVYQLALALGVPTSIITAVPSPDLWGEADGHNDEDEISSYLGVDAKAAGQTWYSYIDVETGEYTTVGLIERVSRVLDLGSRLDFGDATVPWSAELAKITGQNPPYGAILFKDDVDEATLIAALDGAICTHPLAGLDPDFARSILLAARKADRITRHKVNPNCPAYGDRASLVNAGILTNNL